MARSIVYGASVDIDMGGNPITNVEDPTNDQDVATKKYVDDNAGGGSPTGSAGGVLSGTYPNPGFAVDMATQAELDAHTGDTSDAHDASAISVADSGNNFTGTDVEAVLAELAGMTGGGGNVATDSIWDAAGDLAVGTGANTAAKLAKGSDWDGLVVDSAQSSDLRWVPGASVLLYDYTVAGTDKASIDTGADTPDAGIAGTSAFPALRVLEIFIIARTDDAGATANLNLTVNNDGSSIYDWQRVTGSNTSASANQVLAAAQWQIGVHGSGGSSGYAESYRIAFPNYAGTTFNKQGDLFEARNDATAGNNEMNVRALGYRSTSAITRFKVAANGSAKLKVGSRLLVYAR